MVLNEGMIKAAVIDRLITTGALEDAVLINEMVVANWSRRVDLAVANGRLHAFEIKSDLDTLRRLQDQVSTYLARFDKVTVVTTEKYLRAIKDQLPLQTELWEAYELDGTVQIRVVRRGRVQEVKSKRTLCGFLLKPEFVTFLRSQDVEATVEWPREELIQATEAFSLSKLRQFVLSSLKARYRTTFTAFLKQRKRRVRTRTEDLSRLSKFKITESLQVSHDSDIEPSYVQPNARVLDLVALEQQFGELPPDMPLKVLRRVKHD